MYDIQVEFYTKVGQFHYAKVCIDGGVYISGIKVCPSTKYPNELWVQMPSYKAGKGWKRYIELKNDCLLAQKIYESIQDLGKIEILDAIKDKNIVSRLESKQDNALVDFDDSKPIDFSAIPF